MYEIAVIDLEVAPSEFWRLSPREFWLIYYGKVDRSKREAGKLTDSDIEELKQLLEQHQDDEQ